MNATNLQRAGAHLQIFAALECNANSNSITNIKWGTGQLYHNVLYLSIMENSSASQGP